ncbi:MAG: Gfo/Idh/MocA family oxidoreductase [candidate division Zixibacteria bacterium]|nr:Gfo/Idh/MocA family oxidoreductase [candidate division Zixibacteria bacterium]
MPVRTAVIGVGIMGNVHLDQLAKIPEIVVEAVVDPSEETGKKTVEKHRVPKWFPDTGVMLAEVRPEYVVVASPMPYHAADAIAAFDAGAHVLIEKPLCTSMEEAEAIRAAALRAGRLFTMGFQMRQFSANRTLRQHVEEGRMGTIYHSRVWGGHVMNYPWGRYFHRKSVSLGGVVANTTVHPLDALLWIIGSPEPVAISASSFCKLVRMPDPPINFSGTIDEVSVEDFAHAHVRFADGSSMSIEGNWLMHATDRIMGFEIHGTLATAQSVAPQWQPEHGKEVETVDLEKDIAWHEGTRQEHEEFIRAIRGEGTPMVTFHQALTVQKILCGLYESAAQDREIRL